MIEGSELVLLGKIAGTHGIKGELRVVPFSGEFGTISSLESVLLKGPSGRMEAFRVATCRANGKKVILALDSYNDINQVLHLVGHELYARREDFPELDSGEYYWCDLLGLTVNTESGETLGELTDILATGSNDVYVVTGTREYLIPAVEDIVVSIDLEKGVMTISPPEGLLDL